MTSTGFSTAAAVGVAAGYDAGVAARRGIDIRRTFGVVLPTAVDDTLCTTLLGVVLKSGLFTGLTSSERGFVCKESNVSIGWRESHCACKHVPSIGAPETPWSDVKATEMSRSDRIVNMLNDVNSVGSSEMGYQKPPESG